MCPLRWHCTGEQLRTGFRLYGYWSIQVFFRCGIEDKSPARVARARRYLKSMLWSEPSEEPRPWMTGARFGKGWVPVPLLVGFLWCWRRRLMLQVLLGQRLRVLFILGARASSPPDSRGYCFFSLLKFRPWSGRFLDLHHSSTAKSMVFWFSGGRIVTSPVIALLTSLQRSKTASSDSLNLATLQLKLGCLQILGPGCCLQFHTC